jgi:hypothetical protein
MMINESFVADWTISYILHGKRRTRLQDGRGLQHLRHKRTDSLQLAIASPNSSEDTVKDGQFSLVRGYKAPDLRHESNDADLADIGRLSAHVWSCEDNELARIWASQQLYRSTEVAS